MQFHAVGKLSLLLTSQSRQNALHGQMLRVTSQSMKKS